MAKRKGSLLSAFVSDETRTQLRDRAGVVSFLPLGLTLPDPGQPRRLLPSDLAQAVGEGELTPGDALATWEKRVQETTAGEETTEEIRRQNWQELDRLAESIKQHGLINPITVRPRQEGDPLPAGVEYVIVTGERRYWAQSLLAMRGEQIREGEEDGQSPDKIKAIVSPEGVTVRAHQLIENIQREDINAVEKARGLWALRYELSGVTRGSPSVGEDAIDEVDLVPWTRIQEAVGISKRHRIRLTSILELSPGAQALATEHNLAERALRPIVSKLRDHPGLQMQAITQLIAWQEKSESDEAELEQPVSVLVDELIEKLLREAGEGAKVVDEVAQKDKHSDLSARRKRLERRVQGTLSFFDEMGEEELSGVAQSLSDTQRTRMVENLRQLRERVETVLRTLTG